MPLGEFDFVEQISSEIPMRVFASIMGIPERSAARSSAREPAGRSQDPEFGSSPTSWTRRSPSRTRLRSRCSRSASLAAARRANPGDDIVTQLLFAELTPREYDLYFLLLAVAGNETTRHTIATACWPCSSTPNSASACAETRAHATAAEEMLRWATPIHYFRRTATRDGAAGEPIAAGDKVTTWFASGNRDETVFEDPDAFDVGRIPIRRWRSGRAGSTTASVPTSLASRSGSRSRSCSGRSVRARGPPERLRSNIFNGIKRLPVVVR